MTAVYLALLICPFVAIIITVPFVFVHYKKTGVIDVIKCMNFYLMIFFTLGAYFVTMLPFPTLEIVAGMQGSYVQLIPFYCIYDFFVNSGLVISDWKTVLPAIGSGITIGIALNVMMLMPTGFFVQRVRKLRKRYQLLVGFLISLVFELTQLTGLFFIYPRPYRIFDVDDLIQNTIGFFIGAQLAHVWRFFKSPSHITVRQGGEVSFRRRVLADIIDQGILNIIFVVTIKVTKNNIEFFARHPFKSFPIYFVYIMLLNIALSFVTYIFDGKTLGMYVLGLRLRDSRGNRLRLWQCIVRGTIFALYVNMPQIIWWLIKLSINRNIVLSVLFMIIAAELVISYVSYNLSIALHIITHGERLLHEKISRTHLGLELETVIRNRQKVLYRSKLLPEKIPTAADEIYELLCNNDIEKKHCEKMRNMAEDALDMWMTNGLLGHVFTVQIDRRFSKKTLLICVHGKYVPIKRSDDGFFEILSGASISFDTYYTGEINVFAIEI